MPRYFFNVDNRHGECLRDTPGLVDGGRLVVEVRDEAGAVLLTVIAEVEDPPAG